MALTILAIGLLVFVGHVLADFFQRTKVPDVLILMFAGILLGPVFGIVEPADFGKVGPVFTTLALIIILFEGGIHLNIKQLGSAAGETLALSLATFATTTLVVAHLADLLLPLDFLTGLLVGTILGGTSSAVVVPLIRALAMEARPSTVLFLESALTDVLVIVIALGLIRALSAGTVGELAAVDGGSLVVEILLSFVVAGLIGIAGALVVGDLGQGQAGTEHDFHYAGLRIHSVRCGRALGLQRRHCDPRIRCGRRQLPQHPRAAVRKGL